MPTLGPVFSVNAGSPLSLYWWETRYSRGFVKKRFLFPPSIIDNKQQPPIRSESFPPPAALALPLAVSFRLLLGRPVAEFRRTLSKF